MMRKNTKTALQAKSKIKHVVYDRFSTFAADDGNGTLGALETINCTTVDGALKAGLGMTPFYTYNEELFPYEKNEPKVYFSKQDPSTSVIHMSVITQNGIGYYLDEEESLTIEYKRYMQQMQAFESFLEDGSNILIVVGGGGLFKYEKGVEKRSDVRNIRKGVLFNNRLYLMQNVHTFLYSDVCDYFNFDATSDDSGSINLPFNMTDVKAMVEFNGNIYVFYEFDIVEIKIAGSSREFKVSKIFYGGGRICNDAVGKFGDKLCILAEDGVYFFDGKTTKKVFEKLNIKPMQHSLFFGHATCAGKYLLRYQDQDGVDKSVVLYPDGEYGYYTTCFKGLGRYRGRVFCVYNNLLYIIEENVSMPSGEFRYFHSVEQDFGVKGKKTLKSLHFEGEGALAVDIYADGERKIYKTYLSFEDGKAVLNLNMRGEKFVVRFWVFTNSSIRKMTAEVEYLE